MELFYYRDPKLNFGDDLNEYVWQHVLPREVRDAPGTVLIGIGSILTEEWVGKYSSRRDTVMVLGSGTSYDMPPKDMSGWHVLALRGPLTAEMVQRPDAAITDGAILLADTPIARAVKPQDRSDVIFMVHHRTIRQSPWADIARKAGVKFVSPQQPVDVILEAFSKAKLVVTEAMHGAIVADTLRIPWKPVVISPAIDEFKWRDWCLSMDVPFEPVRIPAGHSYDVRHYDAMSAILQRAGITGHQLLLGKRSRAELAPYFASRFSPDMKRRLLRPFDGTRMNRLINFVRLPANAMFESRAVRALAAAAEGPGYLSSDAVFDLRLGQMRRALEQARRLALRAAG